MSLSTPLRPQSPRSAMSLGLTMADMGEAAYEPVRASFAAAAIGLLVEEIATGRLPKRTGLTTAEAHAELAVFLPE